PGLVPLPEALARAEQGLGEHGVLVERLGRALAAELPLLTRDGGFIAPGYAPELDQLRELRDDSRRAIAALQARYAEASGVASLHAEGAAECGWVRPEVEAGAAFEIRGGRHPTVEAALAGKGAFIANDCVLGEDRIWLVTGPNMAGKSTFLRQNALIAILAQIGAFVPASAARIGIIDRLFSRVGAADDLARGRSTFMVEMVETAAILNQAGRRRLGAARRRSAAVPRRAADAGHTRAETVRSRRYAARHPPGRTFPARGSRPSLPPQIPAAGLIVRFRRGAGPAR